MYKIGRVLLMAILTVCFVALAACESKLSPPIQTEMLVIELPTAVEYIETVGDYFIYMENGAIKIRHKDTGLITEISGFDYATNRAGILVCWNLSGKNEYYHIGGLKVPSDQLVEEPFTWWGENGSLSTFRNYAKLYGYMNKQGMVVIPAQYWLGCEFSEGFAYVEKGNGTEGFIDLNGIFQKLCVNGSGLDGFFDGRLLVQQYGNEKNPKVSNYITDQNMLLITDLPPALPTSEGFPFLDARNFSEGLAAVQIGNNWGYIDADGKITISPQFKNAFSFSDGVAVVEFFDNTFGRIDYNGTLIGTKVAIPGYTVTGEYHDNTYLVEGENGFNLANDAGELLLKEDYLLIEWAAPVWSLTGQFGPDRNDIAGLTTYGSKTNCYLAKFNEPYQMTVDYRLPERIYKDTLSLRQALINFKTGETILSAQETWYWGEGLLPAADKSGKIGYVDVTGQYVIAPQFDRAAEFKSGLAYVEIGNRSGFIANPLLYKSGWDADVLKRADAIGVPQTEIAGSITKKQFLDILEYTFISIGEFPLEVSDDFIVSATGNNEYLTRADAYAILSNISTQLGDFVEFLYVPEEIAKNLTPKQRDALGYVASLGIVDFVKDNVQDVLTSSDAKSLIVHYVEATYDKICRVGDKETVSTTPY